MVTGLSIPGVTSISAGSLSEEPYMVTTETTYVVKGTSPGIVTSFTSTIIGSSAGVLLGMRVTLYRLYCPDNRVHETVTDVFETSRRTMSWTVAGPGHEWKGLLCLQTFKHFYDIIKFQEPFYTLILRFHCEKLARSDTLSLFYGTP